MHPRNDTRIYTKQALSLFEFAEQVDSIVADGLGSSFEKKTGISYFDLGKPKGKKIFDLFKNYLGIIRVVYKLRPIVIHFHDLSFYR